MKKLLFLLIMLAFLLPAKAQSSTIVDNGPYLTINYSDGDTVCVGKELVVHIKAHGSEVFLMTSQKWSPGSLTKIVSLSPTDFGYASTTALRSYLATICFKAYDVTYRYTDDNMDTVSYSYGGTVQYYEVMSYPSDTVINYTIVPQ